MRSVSFDFYARFLLVLCLTYSLLNHFQEQFLNSLFFFFFLALKKLFLNLYFLPSLNADTTQLYHPFAQTKRQEILQPKICYSFNITKKMKQIPNSVLQNSGFSLLIYGASNWWLWFKKRPVIASTSAASFLMLIVVAAFLLSFGINTVNIPNSKRKSFFVIFMINQFYALW